MVAITYRVVDIALAFLESTAICNGWDQNSGFLRVSTDTDGNSAATVLEVGKQVEEGDGQSRSASR
jgi:hypothetical protein